MKRVVCSRSSRESNTSIEALMLGIRKKDRVTNGTGTSPSSYELSLLADAFPSNNRYYPLTMNLNVAVYFVGLFYGCTAGGQHSPGLYLLLIESTSPNKLTHYKALALVMEVTLNSSAK